MNYSIGFPPPTNWQPACMMYGTTFDAANDGTLDTRRIAEWLRLIPRGSTVISDVESVIGASVFNGSTRGINQMNAIDRAVSGQGHTCFHYGFPSARNVGNDLAENRHDYFIAGRQCEFIGQANAVCQSCYFTSDWPADYWQHVGAVTRRVANAENKRVYLTVQPRFTEYDPIVANRLSLPDIDQRLEWCYDLIGWFGGIDGWVIWGDGGVDFRKMAMLNPDLDQWNNMQRLVIQAATEEWGNRYRRDMNSPFNETMATNDNNAECAELAAMLDSLSAPATRTTTKEVR